VVSIVLRLVYFGILLLCTAGAAFSQVNYDAGRNLKEWTTTGDYLVDSHEWFGDTLIVSSVFRYVYDTIQRTQGDTIIDVVRYGSAQGIHIYPDENLPATINIIDTAFIPVSTPVRYKDKMYWGGQKSFTPPDTSSWIVLYEFDPSTLEYKTLTLHEADAGFHYFHDLEIRGDLLSAITRVGEAGNRRYFMNIVDPSDWKLLAHAPLEWTTGNSNPSSERLHTSDVQIINGDTTVIVVGKEVNSRVNDAAFLKRYNLDGTELLTDYLEYQFVGGYWSEYNVRRNYDRTILSLRSDSLLFFLSNHVHDNFEADSTGSVDFKAYLINPSTYERIDSSDTGDPAFIAGMQAMMDYAVIGDTLVAVGQCGVTLVEDSTYAVSGPNPLAYQLGVVAYDMNTLEMLWTKRIIAETEFGSISDDYGVTSSPHNFASTTAMTWKRNELTRFLETEVRIIHLNEHGCPTADPNKTCDDLIWLDQYVSDTDNPSSSGGMVPSIQVVPSLLAVGADNRIQFTAEAIPTSSSNGYTVELYDSNARRLDSATLLDLSTSYTLPSSLTSGIYYAYLRSSTGASIGVGKFVVQ